jgi:hypothetical protein
MRLKVRIPNVEPETYQMPTERPYEECQGTVFKEHQNRDFEKALKATSNS